MSSFSFLQEKPFIQTQDGIFPMKPFLQKAVRVIPCMTITRPDLVPSVLSLSLGIKLSGPLAQAPIRWRWRQVTLAGPSLLCGLQPGDSRHYDLRDTKERRKMVMAARHRSEGNNSPARAFQKPHRFPFLISPVTSGSEMQT